MLRSPCLYVCTESAPRTWWPPGPIWTSERREKNLALLGIEPRFFGHFRHNLVRALKKTVHGIH